MRFRSVQYFTVALFYLVVGGRVTFADLQEATLRRQAQAIATPTTIAVARVRLEKFNLATWQQQLAGEDQAAQRPRSATLQVLDQLKQHGCSEAFMFFKMSTFEHEVDRIAARFSREPDVERLEQTLRPYTAFTTYEWREDLLVISRDDTSAAVEQTGRHGLAEALAKYPDAPVVFSIVPSDAQRQALRLVDARLPPEYGAGTVSQLVEDLRWLVVAVSVEPQFGIAATVQATDEAAAARLGDWIRMQVASAGVRVSERALQWMSELQVAAIDGPRFEIEFTAGGATKTVREWLLRQLPTVVYPLLVDESMNKSLELALAMVNYEATFGHFPAAASYDDDGRPLLSWRIHLLPFLELNELYERFHLDEPWDSEHNRKLISEMPDVFLSAAAKLDRSAGQSNFVAPVGDRFVVDLKSPRRIRDISDGMSRTICILEGDSTLAETWTKPTTEPTQVAKLIQNLGTLHSGRIVVSTADSVTMTLKSSIPAESLERLLRVDDYPPKSGIPDYELLQQYRAR